ncbi:hypothetical protein SmJEL517_g02876 [Synchytrium microbalum]|uniref:Ubiquilin n=1 Tax=Synchytrium microbalum TaxID=1806994 RepID=A0A507BZ82_9FUNG|nr:uncharacterized protein SmJEL517_g02876 [Synchytrium microbalum]TPX34580.1 hypothetical protein SmJEL517_g02876 [Synchytrium microbalum]
MSSANEDTGASSGTINITIHWTGGREKLEISDSSIGIDELKARLATITGITAEQQRLVSSGRVIASEGTVDELIKDGSIITIAKATVREAVPDPVAQAAVLSQPPPQQNVLGIPPEMMPMMQPMLDQFSQNPALLSSLMQSDPRMRNLMENNPELRSMMQSPSFLRQMAETIRNPAAMQNMMRSTDRQLANIENIPGGFAALSSLYSQMGSDERPSDPSTDAANQALAQQLGADDRTQPLPNPWQPRPPPQQSAASRPNVGFPSAFGGLPPYSALYNNPYMNPASPTNPTANPTGYPGYNPEMLRSLLGSMPQQSQPPYNNISTPPVNPFMNPYSPFFYPSMAQQQQQSTTGVTSPTSATTTTPPSSTQTLEEARTRYQSELESLNSMGFTNEEVNIRALRMSGGNVQAAISFLLGE